MIAFDSETTGIDHFHGARPFFVTTCTEEGRIRFWEWDVDPLTRAVITPEEDVKDICLALCSGQELVLQNAKFDCHALDSIGCVKSWPWHLTHDTLIAAHVLSSNTPHDLTSLALQYLEHDIEPLEKSLEKAVLKCRSVIQQARLRQKRKGEDEPLAGWAIAEEGRADMPSAGEKTWKYDSWLPRTLWEYLSKAGHPLAREHPEWRTVLRDYANGDSEVTAALWPVMRAELEHRGLWKIYDEMRKLASVLWEMERGGVTIYDDAAVDTILLFEEQVAEEEAVCLNIAAGLGYDLKLPKGGSNNGSLLRFCFGDDGGNRWLNLPVVARTEKGAPSLNKDAMAVYKDVLEVGSVGVAFLDSFTARRRRATYITYLESYRRYGLPHECGEDGWLLLHPSINQTGADNLRKSSSNPNEANVGKQEIEGRTLRHVFRPPPGYEWWSLDGENLELRIPTFEAKETRLVEVFLEPSKPPYFGSYHLVVFDALYPELFRQYGAECKQRYESTLYQWVKNGNFALVYGAQRSTADRTYHVAGAYDLIRNRFPHIAELSAKMIAFANKRGYVETLPDSEVDPLHGYPLLCSRSRSGDVLPTVPLNYHVSGSANWWERRAMIKCHNRIKEWRQKEGFACTMVLDVHDEIVFQMPKGKGKEPWRTNLPRVAELRELMMSCGPPLGVPTPVSVEYHAYNWAEGRKVNMEKELEYHG